MKRTMSPNKHGNSATIPTTLPRLAGTKPFHTCNCQNNTDEKVMMKEGNKSLPLAVIIPPPPRTKNYNPSLVASKVSLTCNL